MAGAADPSVADRFGRGRPRSREERAAPRPSRRPGGEDAHPFEALLQCPVELGAAQASIDYSDDDLDAAVPGADPGLHDLALAYAESLLAARNRQDEIRHAVRSAIALLGPANSSMAGIAAELGCSSRTLQRRLETSGTCFRDLLYAYRMEEAGLMLCRTKASIEYIADRLGYSEPSAFSRAVHDWWGISPRELRARGGDR
ncbi:MAG: helix-turn-helix transcriptional regulator [Sphingomonas bacterium]